MVKLAKTAIPSYDCRVPNSSIVVDPLIQYENKLFCFKVGSKNELKLTQFLLSIDGPPPTSISYSITNKSYPNLLNFLTYDSQKPSINVSKNSMLGTYTFNVVG